MNDQGQVMAKRIRPKVSLTIRGDKHAELLAVKRAAGRSITSLIDSMLDAAGAPVRAKPLPPPRRVICPDKLRAAIKATGLPQMTIAVEAGLSCSSISRWLSCDNQPTPAGMSALCKALGVEPEAITVIK